jgi:4-amino-4-deoxy-L-arabinose transferase-like glycosyltransferase
MPEEVIAVVDSFAVRYRVWMVALLSVVFVLLFTRLGARALWSSEFRWAEISREMITTGNYFWPTINGQVYYDKPLGSYWLVIASTVFAGGMNELAARIPCAISGFVAVALLMVIVRRLYDSRTALLSGFILATSFSFVFFSRHASADVETITGELAAIALFLRKERAGAGWWVVGLWIVMAATSLTKGLLGFVLPILVIGAFATFGDGLAELSRGLMHGRISAPVKRLIERNRWLFNAKSLIAIPIGIAIYALPFEISHRMMGTEKGLAMVYRENVVRFFHPFDHRGAFYIYTYWVFILMAPWSILLPGALIQTHFQRSIDASPAQSDRFALIFFWATFAFYTVSGSRRSYYILPILPAGAILIARALVWPSPDRSKLGDRLIFAGYWILAGATIVGIASLIPAGVVLSGKLALLPVIPDRVAFVAAWMASVAAIFWAVRSLSRERIAVSMCVMAYTMLGYIYLFAMPAADAWRGEKPFAAEVMRQTRGETSGVVLFRNQGPLFYLNPPRPIPEFESKSDLEGEIAKGTVRYFIARRRDIPTLAVPTQTVATEASFPWESDYNFRNKVVLVRVGPRAAH